MMLRLLRPNNRDIAEAAQAIEGFDGAWGFARPGMRRVPSFQPAELWMMLPTSQEAMSDIGRHVGIDAESFFAQVLRSKQRTITVNFFKVSRGWLRAAAWISNITLDLDTATVFVGSIAGRTQNDMWRQFQAFLDHAGAPRETPAAAVAALSS